MAFSKTLERELNRLFRERTHWLRSELGDKAALHDGQIYRARVT